METVPQAVGTFNSGLPTFMGITSGDADTRPFAYLNYMLFNNSFTMVDAGAIRVPTASGFDPCNEATSQPARLGFQPITVTTTGYMYIWVSNETEATKVWFDDLKVTHTQDVVTQSTDYGAWGDIVREQRTNVLNDYRYAYQGMYAEKDLETGLEHFELREYDPVIGRTLTIDPARQFYSPYDWVGNNPVSGIDPSGGMEPVFDSQGTYRGDTKEGFTGKPIIYDGDADFTSMSAAELIANGGNFIGPQMQLLSNQAFARIFNEMISRLPELGDMGLILNKSVSIYQNLDNTSLNDGRPRLAPFSTTENSSGENFPVKVTIRLYGNRIANGPEITVENIQNAVGIHEFLCHGFFGYGDVTNTHYKAYEFQMKHSTWKKTTPDFKTLMINNYADYMSPRPH